MSPPSLPLINTLLSTFSSLALDPDNPTLFTILSKLAPLRLCEEYH
jgi:hypothetical protein